MLTVWIAIEYTVFLTSILTIFVDISFNAIRVFYKLLLTYSLKEINSYVSHMLYLYNNWYIYPTDKIPENDVNTISNYILYIHWIHTFDKFFYNEFLPL